MQLSKGDGINVVNSPDKLKIPETVNLYAFGTKIEIDKTVEYDLSGVPGGKRNTVIRSLAAHHGITGQSGDPNTVEAGRTRNFLSQIKEKVTSILLIS